jgi:hypothetical protein
MTSQYRDTLKDELFLTVVTFAAFVVLVCVLAVGMLTTLFPFRTVERMPSGICSTSVNCVTVRKLPRKTVSGPKAIASLPKHTVSLDPKDGPAARSLSPYKDIGSPMILIWRGFQSELGG